MSDSRLRELERRWKETGSVEDEAAYLQERVRAGDIANDRLCLAAYVGSTAARLVLGEDNYPQRDGHELFDWANGLEPCGMEARVRAATASVIPLLRRFESQFPTRKNPRRIITQIMEWITCPCEQHAHRIIMRHPVFTDQLCDNPPTTIGFVVTTILSDIVRAIQSEFEEDFQNLISAATAGDIGGHEPSPQTDIDEAMQAIQEMMIPWALGYSDPVRERAEARNTSPTG